MIRTRHVAIVFSLVGCVSAQCPVDDVAGGLGKAGGPMTIAEHDDGTGMRMWITGWVGSSTDFGVRRLTGSAWQSVGAPFRWGTASTLFDPGTGPQLYCAAGKTGTGGVQRWDGATWTPVGSLASAFVLYVADLGAGDVLLAGDSDVQQWNGSSWQLIYSTPRHFPNLPGRVVAMATLPGVAGNELWVGGSFGTNRDVNLVRRSPAGVWSSTGVAANGTVIALHVHDDGTGPVLFAAGDFTTIGGVSASRIARWNGSTWIALGGAPLAANVQAMATCDLGGGPRLYAGLADGRILRLDDNGWASVGVANSQITALSALPSRGTLAAGGTFSRVSGASAVGVAEWQGSNWSQLGEPVTDDYPGIAHAMCAAASATGPELYVAGEFDTAGGVEATNIARFAHGSWTPLGGGLTTASSAPLVTALAVHTDSSGRALFAGGLRLDIADGAVPIANIARWDGARWTSPGGGLPGAQIIALESYAGSLFATSWRSTAIGMVVRWDGTAWRRADQGVAGVVPRDLRQVDLGSGPQLCLGSESGMFVWSGAAWVPLGPAQELALPTAFVDLTGPRLYAVSGASVVRWAGSSWQVVGAASGSLAEVLSLAVFDDGTGQRLWATGHFTHIAGIAAANVARWDGLTWSVPSPAGLGEALRISGQQSAIGSCTATTGNGIFVAGWLGTAGGVAVNGIARWGCGTSPSIAWSQPGGAGGLVSVTNSNLVAGGVYFNLMSLEPCPGGPGTGPFLGLCASTPSALQFLIGQTLLPLGTPLFHFGAITPYSVWGPYSLPPITVDAVAIAMTNGLIGGVSPVVRIVVR
jgi:hypothetical protein